MIIGDVFVFAIQIEVTEILQNKRFKNGIFHIIINGEQFLPAKRVDYDLYNIIRSLKESFNDAEQNLPREDIGEKDIKTQDLNYENTGPVNLIFLNTEGILYQDGLSMYLGYSNNEERLIFSIDYEENWQEVRFPRGTVEKVINALPEFKDLSI